MNKDTSKLPKKRRVWRFLFRFAAIVSILFLIVTVWINWSGSRARDTALAELEQRGLWPIASSISTIDDADNGAKAFLAAIQQARLPDDDTYDTEGLPRLGSWEDTWFGVAISPDMADRISAYVEYRREFRALVEKARQYDSYEYNIDWRDIVNGELLLFGAQRRACSNLSVFSLPEQTLDHGDTAIDHLAAIVDLRDSFSEQGPLLQGLVSISIDAMVNNELEEALSRVAPSRESIAAIRQRLQEINLTQDLVTSLGNELQYQAVQLLNLNQLMADHIGVVPQWARQNTSGNLKIDQHLTRVCYRIWPGVWKNWMADELTRTLHVYDQVVAVRDQPVLIRKYLTEAEHTPEKIPGTVFIPTIGRIYLQSLTCRRVTLIALEIEQHRLQHDRWPETLAELGYQNIIDPYSESQLRYRHVNDGVVVYSLGPNGTDEGGVQHGIFDPELDIDFRLLDPAVRGTLPLPSEPQEP